MDIKYEPWEELLHKKKLSDPEFRSLRLGNSRILLADPYNPPARGWDVPRDKADVPPDEWVDFAEEVAESIRLDGLLGLIRPRIVRLHQTTPSYGPFSGRSALAVVWSFNSGNGGICHQTILDPESMSVRAAAEVLLYEMDAIIAMLLHEATWAAIER